jgi:membrane protease YdiL (CAAX protease family)
MICAVPGSGVRCSQVKRKRSMLRPSTGGQVISQKTTIGALDAAVIVVICFGVLIVLSIRAVFAGFPDAPFTNAGLIWLVGTELILATAALLFLRARGFAVGTLVPEPTLRATLLGIILFFTAWIAGILVTAPVAHAMPEQPIERMVADAQLSGPILVIFAMVNGAFEEIFLLGVLVRGLRGFGLSVAVGVPLLVRVLYHLYQGPVGALWILTFGLVFTAFYLRSVSLWPPVLAHVLWDIVPFS